MALKDLKVDELKKVADFFVKDVVAAKPDKPTKKELLAALASEDGQGPVTDEDYEETYLPTVAEEEANKPKEEKPVEKPKKKIPSPDDEDEEGAEEVLVYYTGNNPRWDVIGYTFIKRHPFASVPLEKAEWLVKNQPERFRLALPSEVKDYYN